MALFFFHFFDGRDRFMDDLGVDLPSADQAYLEAVATATGMWGELIASRTDPSCCAFDIANSEGLTINRVEFSELLENCRPAISKSPPTDVGRPLAETPRRAVMARADLVTSLTQVRQSLAEASALLSRLEAMQRPRRFNDAARR